MRTHRQSGKRWLGVLAGASLLVSGLGTGAAHADRGVPQAPEPDVSHIAQEVLDDLAETGEADFWVRFAARPDLSQFHQVADWDARGWAVYEALSSTAAESQIDAVEVLRAEGLEFETFYITNAIKVVGGDTATVTSLASLPGVDAVYPSFEVIPPDPVEDDSMAPSAVAWGVEDINAPDVWDLGITGQGMVLATIDTGVMYDHPALVGNYRGNNGDGTFDHNYNWYNHGHGSPGFPTDSNGHGTHVQGTMVGDDGADNQIGVAPGATWIATNGCCPSDAALIASGEWTLAPTDLAGANPDPDLRPHVINNSWGSTQPSNDPFMEDISEAWAASGQFAVFANGNSGSACATSGSPGSRIINYSVGNYNASHLISGTSGRGPGQDGELKPDISAPGSQIYSAWPDGDYNTISGTSMASPHVAGAVGLLWSSSPALLGDVEATRNLLDSTAIDTEDLQCGGTAANNNVFGEGRLDVAELVAQAPSDAGTLTGTVTDASTGEPIEGAMVQATGPIDRVVTTGATGGYTIALSEGDYTVEVSMFGYATDSDTATVAEDTVTTHDVALDVLATATLSGTVTDGSGLGGPLPATVTIAGTPLSAETDPETGDYSLSVPVGDHTVTATTAVPGYLPGSQDITVAPGGTTADFALTVDVAACEAPGYVGGRDGTTETFDDTSAPAGWTVTDDEGNGQTWAFNNPGGRANLTGGSGGFAIVDNDFYGDGNTQRTGLVTPTLDFSDADYPVMEFAQDYRVFDAFGPQWADVDISLDGGDTWTTLLHQTLESRGPDAVVVPLEGAAGQDDVHVRFYDVDEGWTWWWQIDDVFLGNATCDPGDQPAIELDPSAISSTQAPDVSTDHVLTVSNTGTADLEWEIVETEAETAPTAPDASLVLPSGADRSSTQHAGPGQAPAVVAPANVPAVASLTEGFEDVTALPGAGWAMVNTSEPVGGTGWFQGNPDVFGSHLGAPNAYIAANFNNTGGSPGNISNWLVTPELDLVNGSELSFWTRSTGSDFPDRLEVRLSTSGPSTDVGTGFDSVGDFDRQLLVINEDLGSGYPAEWTEFTVTVDELESPTTGRLALRYHVPNGGPPGNNSDYIGIDTVSYSAPAPTCAEEVDASWLSVAPTSGTTGAGASTDVTVSLDSTGLAEGSYTAQLCVESNDPSAPQSYVPVTLDVADEPETAPVIGVDPAAVDATQEQEQITTHEVAISNDGDADLTWEVTEAEADHAPGAPDTSLVLPQGADRSSAQPAGPGQAPAVVAPADVLSVDSLSEGFEDITALPGAGWAITNNSEPVGLNNWFQGNTEVFDSHEGAPDAYAGANFNSAGLAPGNISNWLMTPEVDLVNGSELSFYTRTVANPANWPDRLEVRLSTNGDSTDVGTGYTGVGDFDTVLVSVNPDLTATGYPGAWTEYTATIEDLEAPTTGRLAFRYFVPNGGPAGENSNYIGIDTVTYEASEVVEPTACDAPTDVSWLSVSPTSGTTAPGEASTLEVSLDSTGLEVGDYSAQLCVTSNDPQTPLVQVPVTLTVTEAQEPPELIVDRLFGPDRYATAAAISQELHGPGVEVVYVATGTEYADALAGSALAGSQEVPVLLTRSDHLPVATAAELGRLAPDRVVLFGGTEAITEPVAGLIGTAADAPVTRLLGPDRYGTAAAIAAEFTDPDIVYVATGQEFADALAGAARAGALDVPVLLVRSDHLPSATAAALTDLAPSQIRVLGGESAVSADVATALEGYAPVSRIAGEDRYETAVQITADYTSADTVYLASGQQWPDALAGGALAGATDQPLLLTKEVLIPGVIGTELQRLEPPRVVLLGGEDAVGAEVVTALHELLP